MVLPKASVKASFFFEVVNVFENRINVNNIVIECHFNFELNEGFGYSFIQINYGML